MTTTEIKRIDNQIKALVSSAIFNVFNDPDFGFELSLKAKKDYLYQLKITEQFL